MKYCFIASKYLYAVTGQIQIIKVKYIKDLVSKTHIYEKIVSKNNHMVNVTLKNPIPDAKNSIATFIYLTMIMMFTESNSNFTLVY